VLKGGDAPNGFSAAGRPDSTAFLGGPGPGARVLPVDVADLNDWQRAVYGEILERGPLTMDRVIAATALPAKEVRPLLAQLEEARLILLRDDGWYAP
jgi:predicted Rossmann fold nucleotide-binding protein DprA/Smf involved in DNA uptake